MKDYDGFLKDLSTLISYESVQGEKMAGAPFGTEVKKALRSFLDLAQSFGFETVNYDDYIGEAVYGDLKKGCEKREG
ncbi:MAG: hypothetical protein J5662_09515 [Clostridia bacterium]|nr:hypothetical protein [Clostridia bacterium]